MQQESKYTKTKVIGGYTLLFLLSILTAALLYKQITKLIVNEESVGNANRKLFIVGNTISGLYEAEALSSAFIQTGSQKYFRDYMALMEETKSNIDSLRVLTTRLDQQLRLDTIGNLLTEKVRNLKDLAYAKRSFIPEEFYNKAIAHIESGRDSLPEEANVVKRYVTTLDSFYVKTEKKKRWGLFSRSQPDSVLQVSPVHHIVFDTLDNTFQNTDTVVNILKSTWEDVQKQAQAINQKINQKEYALISQSANITDQLKTIISAYEKEEINNASLKQQTREQTITTVIRIFAWIAIIAFLLVVFFIFFIFRDLSRGQRYRRELEAANQYAAQLLKSREKMILTVTHDIKSPLSSVIGYIELLDNTPINERQRYFLKNMRGSSEHILKLIGNLLDLSKLENNKMQVEEVAFNPTQLFQEIIGNFMPLAAKKQLELTGKFGKDLNGDCKGDALRIRQIITNILSNAVKYTARGSIRFSAVSSTDDKQIILKIQDTGSGMTPEEQKLIFEEFTRLKSHATIEGTGLGLTITLKLIDLLGGRMELQSEPGKGSCFTIFLPLQKVSTPSVPVQDNTAPPATPRQLSDKSSQLRILLVDDDPLQLEMARGLLENNGIYPTTTTHPGEVPGLLQQESYDLVFSDIQMPEMNGFELVKQIRALESAKTIPVIALSADSDKQPDDYLAGGFTAYLAKPFTSASLLQLIGKITGFELRSRKEDTPAVSPVEKDNAVGYTLDNILRFADNDPEAMQKILRSFITTTGENIALLKQYLETKDQDGIARLAHKMLPLFRQLEAQAIIDPLQKLEHPEKAGLSDEDIAGLTNDVIKKAELLIQLIQ